MNAQWNAEVGISILGPLVGVVAVLLAVLLWQFKRWSDARPAVNFFVVGGETSGGQLFGFDVENPGHGPAYNCSLFVTWSERPVWHNQSLRPSVPIHIPVPIGADVQQRELEDITARLDFSDSFGRQYRASLGLKQEWRTDHHVFFVHQAGQLTTTRPRWLRDLFCWRTVYP